MSDIDREIQQVFPVGPTNAPGAGPYVLATIEVIGGFELFGYHEGWGQGFRVTSQNIIAEAETLFSALQLWAKRKVCEHDFSPLVDGGRPRVLCGKCGVRRREVRGE